jgi:outer membrane protein assembly factor BamD (BamD/ComL family)
MKLKILLSLTIFIVFTSSCVQQSEYDKLSDENKELKEQLDELENGAVRLYGQAVELTKNNELEKAEEKLKILFDRHSETDESKKGRLLAVKIKSKKIENADNTSYKNALSVNTIESLEKYIAVNPKGRFVTECKRNITSVLKENEQKDYENALVTTSSYTVEEFISKYPNHKSVKSFRKKIIELEVDEIFGDKNTGQLPSYDRNSSSYSSYSEIEIENGTQCNLVVRYSGTDTKMIEVPAGATRSISMTSGTYRIAASACGSNYAGTENLQGNYSTRYYITTNRY